MSREVKEEEEREAKGFGEKNDKERTMTHKHLVSECSKSRCQRLVYGKRVGGKQCRTRYKGLKQAFKKHGERMIM